MYVHFTNTHVIIGGLALFLLIIFALAAFLDKRWRTAAPHRDVGSDHKPNSLRQSSSRDDKDGSSKLYTRHADLSAMVSAPLTSVFLCAAGISRMSQGTDPTTILVRSRILLAEEEEL